MAYASLLDELVDQLPGHGHLQQVFYHTDVEEARQIVKRATEQLKLSSIRFLLKLERFEKQPALGDPYREAYDVLIEGLRELRPKLKLLPPMGWRREDGKEVLS